MRISRQRHRPLNTTARLLGKPPRCPEYNPGLYTVSELDQMIFVDGYIPVANAGEFDKIRTGNAETMGAGTCWENTYTTGTNKKYVQVLAIDFAGFGTWTTHYNCNITYDGNELALSNATMTSGFFQAHSGAGYNQELRNMRIVNCSLNAPFISNIAILTRDIRSGVLENNTFLNCSMTSADQSGMMFNTLGSLTDNLIVDNCHVYGGDISGRNNVGGLFGRSLNPSSSYTTTITNCSNSADIFASLRFAGGIGGSAQRCSISYCSNIGDILGNGMNGGILGDATGNIEIFKCNVNSCSVTSDGDGTNTLTGGIVGRASNNDNTIYQCIVDGCLIESVGNQVNTSCGGICGTGGGASGNIIYECLVINCIVKNDTGRYIGGIIGRSGRTSGGQIMPVINCACYNTTIYGINIKGGIVGYIEQNSNYVENCISNAVIDSPNTNDGGLIGLRSNSPTISDSYWDIDVSGILVSSGGSGQTTSALQTPTSNTGIYANYDPAIWDFGTSSEYPKLINTP